MIRLRRRSGLAGALLCLAALGGSSLQGQTNYGGPNVLSRASSIMGRPAGLAPLRVRFFGSLSGVYNSGLTSPVIGSTGNVGPASTSGFSAGGGIYSISNTRYSQTTIGYNGTYSYTHGISQFSGVNQHLAINYERMLSRRWSFFTGHSAGTQTNVLEARRVSQRDTAFQNLFGDPYYTYFEPVDAKLAFYSSGAGFHFQKSRRLSISFDGGVFAVRRNGSLADSQGEQAQAEASYQFSRNQSIGVVFGFSHFSFNKQFGESYNLTPMLSYSRRLNRSWSMYVRGGQYRVEADRLRTVPLDPFIAFLTGRTTTVEAFHGVSKGTAFAAGINGQWTQRHGLTVSVDRSISGGNGLTLTAQSETAGAHYQFSGRKNYSFGFGYVFARLQPLLTSQVNANYTSHGGEAGFSYRLNSYLFLTSALNSQRVGYVSTPFGRNRWTASIGIAASPGELPLKWK
jgi:hypothetical protein